VNTRESTSLSSRYQAVVVIQSEAGDSVSVALVEGLYLFERLEYDSNPRMKVNDVFLTAEMSYFFSELREV